MICSKCKKTVYRAFSYTDENGIWRSQECQDCAAGKVYPGMTTDEKIRSRTLRADGSVATGLEGIRLRDARRKMQSNSSRY